MSYPGGSMDTAGKHVHSRRDPKGADMPEARPPARQPEDLGRFFVERANAGDVEGLVALYEPEAILAVPGGVAAGTEQIRRAHQRFLAGRPVLTGESQPAQRNGELALTSTRFPGGATAEVARRQPDGTWLWVIDQPSILR
jgi:ketosteroid isomerase-like protein